MSSASRSSVPQQTVRVDTVVVGAGAIGLASALRLAEADGERADVWLVEQHEGIGRETSSRNSGVIHAGIYYPKESNKARLCVLGRRELYRWCETHEVPHERSGKWIIATTDEEATALEALAEQARGNDAGAIALVDGAELTRRDPALRGRLALWSPESGVLDAHALLESYHRQARRYGVTSVWKTSVVSAEPKGDGLALRMQSVSGDDYEVLARRVVNAGGLHADRLARSLGIDVTALHYEVVPCKGSYFSLRLGANVEPPRTRLVYPMIAPGSGGLGIHLTQDLAGRWLAGPDAEYVDAPVSSQLYAVDDDKASRFRDSVAQYFPGVIACELSADYAGVRPKRIRGAFADFAIDGPEVHGIAGFVQLSGIESPGLTASLAIGARVAELLAR